MSSTMHTVTVSVGEKELTLETGRLAKQANGAVFARYEGTAVLGTVCCSTSTNEELDYVPLQVEYNEKYYSAGKIPGGFLKREARPKDREILVCRLIDRPLRPLFSKQFKRDIQVVPTVVSADQINPPDVIAMVAASAAVTISDVPFEGPIGAVRVISKEGTFIVNPTFEQIADNELDIVVAGTEAGITMVEGGAKQVSEQVLLDAIEHAREPIANLCKAQLELREKAGREKMTLMQEKQPLSKEKEIVSFARPLLEKACFVIGKMERYSAINDAVAATRAEFSTSIEDTDEKQYHELMENIERDVVRESILKNQKRTDGRGPEDIRPISCEIDVLDCAHGAALFTRGETQALVTTTLGTVYDEQIMDDIEGDRRQNFMLHYNFPPFSVGETGRMGTGRREIGHGNLAHRSLSPLLPPKSTFPYTLRVVSEILESNGSSSMATVCGSSLALMSGGIPIKKAVAGIAMGMVEDGENSVVLSDILGEEDHLGDMDFKVAGTDEGITAFQMDIKMQNVDASMLTKALEQAHKGRLAILETMNAVIDKPREALSTLAPRIFTFKVNPEKIGMLIGPGGKTINSINDRFTVKTNIDDDGSITIYCKNSAKGQEAKDAFIKLLEEPEIGKVYDGVVRRIIDFGAFIEFLPGKEGLCHISRMSSQRLRAVDDLLKLNQVIQVKIVEIDKMGRVNLSLLYEGHENDASRPARGGDRDRGRGGDRDRHGPPRRDRFDRGDRGGSSDRPRSDRGDRDRDRGGSRDRFDRSGPPPRYREGGGRDNPSDGPRGRRRV